MAQTLQLTIPSGQSISNAMEIPSNLGAVRLGMAPAWTSAALSFQISNDGVTFLDLYHAVQTAQGSWTTFEVTLSPVVPGTSLLLPTAGATNVGWLKLRSGTRLQPINQEADRTFTLVLT